jgi:uncharacterized membrane protein
MRTLPGIAVNLITAAFDQWQNATNGVAVTALTLIVLAILARRRLKRLGLKRVAAGTRPSGA